jgi:ABC-type transport system substrate-binding protein
MVERRTLELVHDSPFLVGEDGELKASLVEMSGQQPDCQASLDRTSIECTLKSASFADGTPISLDDVRYTLLAYQAAAGRWMPSDYFKDLFASIEPVGDPSARRIRIKLKRAVALPKDVLIVKILPRKAFELPDKPSTWPEDKKYVESPLGAGPFRRSQEKGNLNIVLNASSSYHRGAPKLDQIQITSMPSAAEQLNALRMKNVHVLVSLRKEDQAQARSAGAWVLPYYLRNWWYLGYNCERDILSNPTVRLALSQVVDRFALGQQLADDVYMAGAKKGTSPGTAKNASVVLISGPFVPESPYYNDTVPQLKFDTEEAARLLGSVQGFAREKGSPSWNYGGKRLVLNLAVRKDLPGAEDVTNMLVQQFADFGIVLLPRLLDQADWNYRVDPVLGGKPNFDLVLGRFSTDAGDEIRPIFQSKARFNYFRYANKALDAKFDEVDRTDDYDKRIGLLKEVHGMLAKDVPCLFLWQADQVAAFSKQVKGYKISSFSFYVNPYKWYLDTSAPKE